MPYPTAAVADPVTYKNSAGATVPALAASADGGSGVISLFVDDPAGAYFVHVVPKDLTGARYNSWNWPTGAVGSATFGAFGSTPNANGGSASGATLTLQPADATHPGGVSIAAQSMSGLKTFLDSVKTGGSYNFTSNAAFQVLTSGGDLKLTSPTGGSVKFADGGSGAHWATANVAGVEVDVVGQGFILKSPDGTRYKIVVANDGTLSATAA